MIEIPVDNGNATLYHKGMTKNDAELRQLALDMMGGSIFTDRHINPNDKDVLPSIFMPLFFMNKEQLAEFEARDVNMIYEHMSKAESRSINGYPIFMSFQFLDKEDTERLQPMLDELKTFQKGE